MRERERRRFFLFPMPVLVFRLDGERSVDTLDILRHVSENSPGLFRSWEILAYDMRRRSSFVLDAQGDDAEQCQEAIDRMIRTSLIYGSAQEMGTVESFRACDYVVVSIKNNGALENLTYQAQTEEYKEFVDSMKRGVLPFFLR